MLDVIRMVCLMNAYFDLLTVVILFLNMREVALLIMSLFKHSALFILVLLTFDVIFLNPFGFC